MKERITKMIKSNDINLVRLGVILSLTKMSIKDCRLMYSEENFKSPGNIRPEIYSDGDVYIRIGRVYVYLLAVYKSDNYRDDKFFYYERENINHDT